jgi:hypothetical protein
MKTKVALQGHILNFARIHEQEEVMETSKETFEAMLILLFKLEETAACDELLKVYQKIFHDQLNDPKRQLH